ncbi:3-phosphoshikimate 1-carboxyvinyltransferase [Motilimonas eburnea]|uniref:3-phosphoshikimate 1-carboxyvinyltransferase n=1 Tax=Motilimonas eburnea TaxID=1737488 RepID=UPI001E4C11AF|nr:3-phosphoshikimate 1-carboxyvinyltransferase [Motilimonas eburnea]MCE2573023.1 3-phosphoshikimate 1-carboxyvinyltransferase [Motilimonas eburnea]
MEPTPSKPKGSIKQDPFVQNLLERIPEDLHDSFSDEQLIHLKVALGARSWGNHAIDLRGTVKLLRWRYYYVFLAGRNRRELSRRERNISRLIQAMILSVFLCFSTALGLLILYLLKSAAGIDLIPGFSFGVWGWFQETWLN